MSRLLCATHGYREPRVYGPRTFIGTPQVIDFTTRSWRRLMYPVRVHPSVDAGMPIVRWTDHDEDRP